MVPFQVFLDRLQRGPRPLQLSSSSARRLLQLSAPPTVLVLGWAWFLGSLAFRILGGFGLAWLLILFGLIWLGLALAGFGLSLLGFWLDSVWVGFGFDSRFGLVLAWFRVDSVDLHRLY